MWPGESQQSFKKGNKVVVVVSAMGDTTDDLIELANKINPNPEPREMDLLLSTGEIVSSTLLAMALHAMGFRAVALSGPQAGISTDSSFSRARITGIEPRRIIKELDKGNIVIVAGFQGLTAENDIATLGRGGSDTTAVALAASLKAKICEIYTDVEGVYTADPRIVPGSAQAGRNRLRRNAGDGHFRRQGHAPPLSGAGPGLQHAHPGSIQHGGQARHDYSRRKKHGSQK